MSGAGARWTDEAWADYLRWREVNRKIFERINRLVSPLNPIRFAGLANRSRCGTSWPAVGRAASPKSTAWFTR